MQWKQCFHLIQLKRHQINQHSSHHKEPLKPLKRAYGTFKEGSVTLSTGPWGPFTGRTSRDTFPFGKSLGITQQCITMLTLLNNLFVECVCYVVVNSEGWTKS